VHRGRRLIFMEGNMIEYTTAGTQGTQGTFSGAKPPASTGQVNTSLRETMIREAAYFRAEHRSFAPGRELEDWFAAEREIDSVLARPGTGGLAQPRAAKS